MAIVRASRFYKADTSFLVEFEAANYRGKSESDPLTGRVEKFETRLCVNTLIDKRGLICDFLTLQDIDKPDFPDVECVSNLFDDHAFLAAANSTSCHRYNISRQDPIVQAQMGVFSCVPLQYGGDVLCDPRNGSPVIAAAGGADATFACNVEKGFESTPGQHYYHKGTYEQDNIYRRFYEAGYRKGELSSELPDDVEIEARIERAGEPTYQWRCPTGFGIHRLATGSHVMFKSNIDMNGKCTVMINGVKKYITSSSSPLYDRRKRVQIFSEEVERLNLVNMNDGFDYLTNISSH